ncbi:hypothetical protein GCM10010361_35580 [Streptomyces olivaceiscleroticus]|uniref:Uncharacterized protein n=1 Tax=Streptomyces olivaceiscleroticus TaxID=68245 RepID=A0ABN1A5V6_9ACTN
MAGPVPGAAGGPVTADRAAATTATTTAAPAGAARPVVGVRPVVGGRPAGVAAVAAEAEAAVPERFPRASRGGRPGDPVWNMQPAHALSHMRPAVINNRRAQAC